MAGKKAREDEDAAFLIESAADPNILPARGTVLAPVEHLVRTLTGRFNESVQASAFGSGSMEQAEPEDE